MKLATAALATSFASLAWAACSVAVPVRQAQVGLGQDFSLRAGEIARVDGGNLRIGFEGVSADSRCPKGEQCVWAGDATVGIWLQRDDGPLQRRELHSAAGAAQEAGALGHVVRLQRLEPYPITGRVIAGGDYVVTLSMRRGTVPAAAADR